ncbi:MAG: cell division protein FtsB [Betaproteobacteria bacterium HGW-Betaproteobacteria-11]|jgi:cell division protein FtsB|nr:MAG: cell division protein FtsB [Betaproteobacteria bacterium HGW-Betaproteobacteria-11]
MSRLTWLLVVLIALLQYPLWLGKGGWFRVWETSRQLDAQRADNQKLEQRNAGLDAEVRDLKSGFEAIEERARFELGFIKEGEVFVQVPQQSAAPAGPGLPNNASAAAPTTPGAGPQSGTPVAVTPAPSFSPATKPAPSGGR